MLSLFRDCTHSFVVIPTSNRCILQPLYLSFMIRAIVYDQCLYQTSYATICLWMMKEYQYIPFLQMPLVSDTFKVLSRVGHGEKPTPLVLQLEVLVCELLTSKESLVPPIQHNPYLQQKPQKHRSYYQRKEDILGLLDTTCLQRNIFFISDPFCSCLFTNQDTIREHKRRTRVPEVAWQQLPLWFQYIHIPTIFKCYLCSGIAWLTPFAFFLEIGWEGRYVCRSPWVASWACPSVRIYSPTVSHHECALVRKHNGQLVRGTLFTDKCMWQI